MVSKRNHMKTVYKAFECVRVCTDNCEDVFANQVKGLPCFLRISNDSSWASVSINPSPSPGTGSNGCTPCNHIRFYMSHVHLLKRCYRMAPQNSSATILQNHVEGKFVGLGRGHAHLCGLDCPWYHHCFQQRRDVRCHCCPSGQITFRQNIRAARL